MRLALAIAATALLIASFANALDATPISFTQPGKYAVTVTAKAPNEAGVMTTKKISLTIDVAGATGFKVTLPKTEFLTTEKINPKIAWATSTSATEDDDDEALYEEETRVVTLVNADGEETQLERTANGQFALGKLTPNTYYLKATTKFNGVTVTAKSPDFEVKEPAVDTSSFKISVNPTYEPGKIITATITWPADTSVKTVELYTATGTLVKPLAPNSITGSFFTTAPAWNAQNNDYTILATATVRGKPYKTSATTTIATPTPQPTTTPATKETTSSQASPSSGSSNGGGGSGTGSGGTTSPAPSSAGQTTEKKENLWDKKYCTVTSPGYKDIYSTFVIEAPSNEAAGKTDFIEMVNDQKLKTHSYKNVKAGEIISINIEKSEATKIVIKSDAFSGQSTKYINEKIVSEQNREQPDACAFKQGTTSPTTGGSAGSGAASGGTGDVVNAGNKHITLSSTWDKQKYNNYEIQLSLVKYEGSRDPLATINVNGKIDGKVKTISGRGKAGDDLTFTTYKIKIHINSVSCSRTILGTCVWGSKADITVTPIN